MVDEQQIAGEALREWHPLPVGSTPDHFVLVAIFLSVFSHLGKVLLPFENALRVKQGIAEDEGATLSARPARNDTVVHGQQQFQIARYLETQSVFQLTYI